MKNLEMAALVLEQLASRGVETLCLCPGSRNGAFVSLLSKSRGFEIISFYDERSAGFFALGRARRDQKPAAVLTTSGTAVSELLSSVIEAYYNNVALVVVSSDRPKRLRGTGAPQTIDQSQIFKNHVEKSWDVEVGDEFHFQASFKKPLHINICFDEPLLDGKVPSMVFYPGKVCHSIHSEVCKIKNFEFDHCLVVVGGLKEPQRQVVASSLLKWEVPFFPESLSGLKSRTELMEKRILGGEKTVSRMIHSGDVRSVLRLGDVPLGRYWRDLDRMEIPVLSISDKNFSGTGKSQIYVHSLLSDPLASIEPLPWDWSGWREKDREIYAKTKEKAENFHFSEAGLIFEITKKIPEDHPVYLGNSLPVRLWDLMDQKHPLVFASRGVNGIDGQLSTALGLHDFKKPIWIILGDITTLYDFSGFWLTPYLIEKKARVNLIVVNNHGGQIFKRLFHDPLFCNKHKLDFGELARFWNWSYQKIEKKTHSNRLDMDFLFFQGRKPGEDSKEKNESRSDSLNFYELSIDEDENEGFWKEYDQL